MHQIVLFGITLLLALNAYSGEIAAKKEVGKHFSGDKKIANQWVNPKSVFAMDVTVIKPDNLKRYTNLKLNKSIGSSGCKSLDGYFCNIPLNQFKKGKRYLFIGAH